MLIRQKTSLALLAHTDKPLSPTVFVKLMFLLRQETILKDEQSFYDFIPYKFGPFSFSLYRELTTLRRDGYVTPDEDRIAICEQNVGLAREKIAELPTTIRQAVGKVVSHYGQKSQSGLVKEVYARYPWYATRRSVLTDLRPEPSVCSKKAHPAVYTVGYEGKSVDAFFDHLLKKGIELIIDVRANPISRRYGFSKKQFSEIARRLGLAYRHMPSLGIPSAYRADLSDFDSYQRLLAKYEREILPKLEEEIKEVGRLMRESPTTLMCVEKDIRCCHRGRLADAVSVNNGLQIKHL